MASFSGVSFSDSFSIGEDVSVPAAVPPPKGGKVRAVRVACKIEGEWWSFASLDDLHEYLAELEEKKLEEVDELVERAVQRILKVGKAKTPPPVIKVSKAPAEVREYVDELNQRIELIYRLKIQEELAARAEEDDLEAILLEVI